MAAVGVAAGIAAAFNAPIAAAVERSILGQHPVFEVQGASTLVAASSLLSYVVLGLLSSFVAVAFTDSLLT